MAGDRFMHGIELEDGDGFSAPASTVIYTMQITSTLVLSYDAGQPVSYQIQTNIPATVYGASNLPAGLSINTATGLISGTISGASTYVVTISATDGRTSDSRPLVVISTKPEHIWYKIDETSGTVLADSGANGHHATISGSYQLNGGLVLDGAGYAQTPALPGSYRSGDVTFSVWARTKSRGALVVGGYTNNYYPASILSNDVPGAGGRGIGASIWTNAGQTYSEYIDGLAFQRMLSGQVSLDWEHLALSFSLSDNTQRIYKNGFMFSSIVAGPPSNVSNTIKIGRHNFDTSSYPGNKSYYFGTIKDVRIYSRALTAQEVNAIYQLGPSQ